MCQSLFEKEKTMRQQVFTKEEIAAHCGVAPRAVSKWLDSGRLKALRERSDTPFLVHRCHLIAFLKEHGMPLGSLDDSLHRVLFVTEDNALIEGVKTELLPTKLFSFDTAENGVQAGRKLESFEPQLVVCDFNIGSGALRLYEEVNSNFIAVVDDGMIEVLKQKIDPWEFCKRSQKLKTLIGLIRMCFEPK